MSVRIPWTTDRIREGFERFKTQENRLPTALEIDSLPYLPSSRYIQKKFGGLEKLRSLLGYSDTHFGKGSFRSTIANRVNERGRAAELSLQNILQDKFGDPFVHIERMFGTLKNRVDFYIFCPEGNFGIDVFHTDSIRNLKSVVNIKSRKYAQFRQTLYLVSADIASSQAQLD